MHFCVDGIAGFRSPQIPKSIETGLRGLLQSDGIINSESLARILDPKDSNLDVVAEVQGYEVVADGSVALKAVIDGLKRRLAKPVATGEKIRLVGE
jgi:hypothetical protein